MRPTASRRIAPLAAGLLVAATGCRTMSTNPVPYVVATAPMRTAAGGDAGTVDVVSGVGGELTVRFHLRGLPPGEHGVHFHAVGSCDASATTPFASAGGHVNPTSMKHGLSNPEGPHAGDLPNLTVTADGTAESSVVTSRMTVTGGGASVFDADGTSIVVHASSDDQRTDPSGNSGARVACGVLTRRE